MNSSLVENPDKNIVIFINDFPSKYMAALTKLSQRLGRPLRAVLLIDAERQAKRNSLPDDQNLCEELVVDFSNDVALSQVVKPLEKNLLLVTCPLERSQLYFKRVIPHVPYVNVPTESSIDYCTDKGKMRQLLFGYDHNISPKAIVVYDATPGSIGKVRKELEFPVIVKPTNLSSSRLVSKVTGEDELRTILGESFTSLHEIYLKHRRHGNEAMVVEEFVEGNLFSTDVYVDAVGKVYVLPFNRFFNGTMAGMDSYQVYQGATHHTLSDEEQRQGSIVARKAVHAVGLRSSVAHIELFHRKDGWKIVELGARPGGWRQEMYQLSYGIDHALNELLVKVGLVPEMPTVIDKYVTTFSIHAPKAGTVESITGIEEVRAHPSLHTLHVKSSVGKKVLPSTQGGSAIVDGLMYHKDLMQLSQAINFARSIIKVNIK